MSVVCRTWSVLQNTRSLRYMLIAVAPTEHQRTLPLDDPEVALETDLLSTAASLATQLCKVRLRWALHFLRGWPAGSVAFLVPAMAMSHVRRFAEDEDNFRKLHLPAPCAMVEELSRRSVFRLPSVQQLFLALGERGFQVTGDFREWLQRDVSRFLGTQLIEDSFQRETKMVSNQMNRRSRVMRQWRRLLERAVLSRVHHYAECPPSAPAFRSSFLPSAAFTPSQKSLSIDVDGLVSTSSATSWYSPAASSLHVEHCDLEFVRILVSENRQDRADKIWHNALLDIPGLVLRRRTPVQGPFFFVLGSFGDTAAPVWPAVRKFASGAEFCFVPSVDEPKQLEFVALLELGEWEGFSCIWRGPLWQTLAWSRIVDGTVAVPTSLEPQSLLALAAKVAFGSLPWPTIRQFGLELGVALPMTSLLETLLGVIMKVLACSEDVALDLVRGRCSAPDTTGMEAFLSLDTGLEIFSKSDEQDVRKEQTQMKSKRTEAKEFMQEYRARRAARAPAAPRGKAKAKALARERKATWCATAPERIPEGFIEHSVAKRMLPAGASIWRTLQTGGWQCHLPPYPRASFSFARWTPRGSVVLCLQYCWRLFLSDRGLPESACPIEGLFDETFEPIG